MQPIAGHKVVIGLGAAAFIHEMHCIKAKKPEHLITRVIARWRTRRPVLVTAVIVYFAGHFLEVWQHDPLSAQTWHELGF